MAAVASLINAMRNPATAGFLIIVSLTAFFVTKSLFMTRSKLVSGIAIVPFAMSSLTVLVIATVFVTSLVGAGKNEFVRVSRGMEQSSSLYAISSDIKAGNNEYLNTLGYSSFSDVAKGVTSGDIVQRVEKEMTTLQSFK